MRKPAKLNEFTYATHPLKVVPFYSQRYKGRCTTLAFTPSVEDIKDGAFITDVPEKMIQTAEPIPLIFGANTKEGILMFKGTIFSS